MANKYQYKERKGNLHKNRFKEKDDQPDYKGGICWQGEQIPLSGWIREDKNGNKYLGLEADEPKQEEPTVLTPPQPPEEEEMPF